MTSGRDALIVCGVYLSTLAVLTILLGPLGSLIAVVLLIMYAVIHTRMTGAKYGKHRRSRRDREHSGTGTSGSSGGATVGTAFGTRAYGTVGTPSRLNARRAFDEAAQELLAAERRVTDLSRDWMEAVRMVAEKRAVFEALPVPEPFPEHDDIVPILAFKASTFWMCTDKVGDVRVCLTNAHGHDPFSTEPATCMNGGRHAAPDLDCTCGYYAVQRREDVQAVAFTGTGVVLTVELWGKVIVHEYGYRAQRQRVLQVDVPGCRCGQPSIGVVIGTSLPTHGLTCCAEHVPSHFSVLQFVTFEQLSERFGVPVSYSPNVPKDLGF